MFKSAIETTNISFVWVPGHKSMHGKDKAGAAFEEPIQNAELIFGSHTNRLNNMERK